MNWKMVGCLIGAWVLLFVIVFRGVQSVGKVFLTLTYLVTHMLGVQNDVSGFAKPYRYSKYQRVKNLVIKNLQDECLKSDLHYRRTH